jgi:hypothetical protein
MKMLRVPLLMIGLLLCAQAFAATDQQNKMTTCNADATAKSLKGDERKAFMSTCLKASAGGQRCRQSPDPAARENENLQRRCGHQSPEGRCAQGVHE